MKNEIVIKCFYASILDFFGTIGLEIQEFFFRRKREKRRKFEKENNLPKKRMISPYQRYFVLLVLLFIISALLRIVVFPTRGIDNKNSEKVEKIKELLEREKDVFGSYPTKLETIKRGNPLRENLLLDAWGTNFKYQIKENSYILISAGKDKKFDTKDDLKLN